MNELPPDIFQRVSSAKSMCKLIEDLPGINHSPFVLDGPWGCGKTIQAERIKEIFKNEHKNIKCIYWNAASSDFSQNPLLMFIFELFKNIAESEQDAFSTKSIPLLKEMFIKGTASILNQITKNILNIDVKQVVEESLTQDNNTDEKNALTKKIKTMLQQAINEKDKINAAEELINIVKEEKELIIIIDELDRCRPTFALELLENIKHLFEKTNCKFLLIMNSESMVSTVSHLYGLDRESATRYLNKYIKTTLILPAIPVNWDGKNDCKSEYFFHQLSKAGIENARLNIQLEFFTMHLFAKKKMELREIEKFVKRIKLLCSSTSTKYAHDSDFFLLCIAAYLIEFEAYTASLLNINKIDSETVLKKLECNVEAIEINSSIRNQFCLIKELINFHTSTREERKHILESNQNSPNSNNLYYIWESFSLFLHYGLLLKTFDY